MKKQLWSAALAALLTMSVPASHAFDVGFSANGPGGSVVIGYLNLLPLDWQVTQAQWADGTLVQRFTGHASQQGGWIIEERGGITIAGGGAMPYDLRLNNYLFLNGSSRVDLTLDDTVVYSDSLRDHRQLNLSMACMCSDLFTPDISEQSFARRDAVAGLAAFEKQSVTWFPDGHFEVHVDDRQEIIFGALPELQSWTLTMLGAAIVAGVRYRKLNAGPSRGTTLADAASRS